MAVTVTRDVPATISDAQIVAELDDLHDEFVAAGGDTSQEWSQITGLPNGAGYRLQWSDEKPPWAWW
jgi:hypothetical protein